MLPEFVLISFLTDFIPFIISDASQYISADGILTVLTLCFLIVFATVAQSKSFMEVCGMDENWVVIKTLRRCHWRWWRFAKRAETIGEMFQDLAIVVGVAQRYLTFAWWLYSDTRSKCISNE